MTSVANMLRHRTHRALALTFTIASLLYHQPLPNWLTFILMDPILLRLILQHVLAAQL